MRWRAFCVFALSLVAMTGCPEDFGKEGTMDRAIHQDVLDGIPKQCTEEDRRMYCGPGNSKEECRKRCG